MAIDSQCSECPNEVICSISDSYPLCEQCKRKHGWKPWKEMNLEEKVEDLNNRVCNISRWNTSDD